ncbi:tRNA lysidine(34) synthetase TilS [Clostridium paridis]|uniref:tRNA(Ile)-lysidine synthase n=1 Tax=Clostridium paridis TaxID=2803863 RepID=A0A937FB11_9CLOT|nr:tRNA lysidine(34) synthetase TilS [Clostridium paridis]MBL4930624.1 tRNA lysidine(34) synthetase TilS [Clostridium paridis]
MKEKVTNYIYENKLINPGDKILVALSGGPDSVCLINLLIEMRDEFNISVGAAHINHMLRGDEADADEEYVRKICELNNIPCYVKRVDINKVSKEKGISSEMAGREERYNFFDEIRTRYLYDKVALAHNSNDQAETVLMRLMRGSGLEGLTGIKAKRDEIYIRPILSCERSEIENYCIEKGLNPRIDKTNLENIYSRNKVRLELIPYIRENFNTDIVNTLNRIALLLEKDSEFIQYYVEEAIEKYCVFNEKLIIKSGLFELKEAILTRVIKNSIMRFSQKYYNIEMKHIYDIVSLQTNKSGSRISLPNELEASNSYGNIEIRFTNNDEKENIKENNILINKENVYNYLVEFYNYNIEFSVLKKDEKLNFSKDSLIKYFDYDKIVSSIEVRRRKDGDAIKPYGMKGKKKLKDLFMDLKIPREDRDEIPLVCFNDEIAWIVGIRTSEDFKITKNTKNILRIKFSRKE